MNTKQILTLLSCCLFSALLAVWLFQQFSPQRVNQAPANQSFSNAGRTYTSTTISSAPSNFISAAEHATPAVVYIRSYYRPGSRWEPNAPLSSSSGSGVIIAPGGLVATNNHVINGAQRIKVILQDQREYDAEVLGIDPATDLALLQISADGLPFLPFGNSDSLRVGEWVLAVGNPFNLESTVTAGIVSAKGRSIDVLEGEDRIESFIQTDAAINPGNSGGALVNDRGELIGINTAIITNSGRNEGFAFAIPGNLAKRILQDLRDFGEVERAVLGVYIQKLNAQQARRLGLPETKGALITKLSTGGAAALAGLEVGDVIIGIEGKEVDSPAEMQEAISHFRPGDRVAVAFIRDGKTENAILVLRDKNNSTAGRRLVHQTETDPLRQLGFEVRALSPTEQNQVGSKGLRVISVFRNSKVADTNMSAGYIITAVNGMPVSKVEDLVYQLEVATDEVLLKGKYEGYSDDYYYQFD